MGAKKITVKSPTPKPPKGGTGHNLPLFLLSLARNQKAPEILKWTTLCNVVTMVEAYRFQNGLTEYYNCQHFVHI
jgi:hypothetical protein